MPRVSHVTSSGFIFDRSESTVAVRCARPLVPMAELEYLREVEPKGGKIAEFRRASGDGRELHLVTVDLPESAGGGQRTITFDAGPGGLEYFRQVTNGLMYTVYGLAAATAVGTLAYLIVHLAS